MAGEAKKVVKVYILVSLPTSMLLDFFHLNFLMHTKLMQHIFHSDWSAQYFFQPLLNLNQKKRGCQTFWIWFRQFLRWNSTRTKKSPKRLKFSKKYVVWFFDGFILQRAKKSHSLKCTACFDTNANPESGTVVEVIDYWNELGLGFDQEAGIEVLL